MLCSALRLFFSMSLQTFEPDIYCNGHYSVNLQIPNLIFLFLCTSIWREKNHKIFIQRGFDQSYFGLVFTMASIRQDLDSSLIWGYISLSMCNRLAVLRVGAIEGIKSSSIYAADNFPWFSIVPRLFQSPFIFFVKVCWLRRQFERIESYAACAFDELSCTAHDLTSFWNNH